LEKQKLARERSNRVILTGRKIAKRINFNEKIDKISSTSKFKNNDVDEVDILLYK
jgi:hypothetical protein